MQILAKNPQILTLILGVDPLQCWWTFDPKTTVLAWLHH